MSAVPSPSWERISVALSGITGATIREIQRSASRKLATTSSTRRFFSGSLISVYGAVLSMYLFAPRTSSQMLSSALLGAHASK